MNEQRQQPEQHDDDAEQVNPPAVFVFPREGERINASGIPLSETAIVALLAAAQIGMQAEPCPIEDCENCNNYRLIWWDTCNALSRSNAIVLQAWLIAEGHGLPDAPWEDVEPDGTPKPRWYEQ